MQESLMLDFWDGRPSVWMSVNNGDPFLHWMLLGHVEDFEVWMHVRLTWTVADDLAESPPTSPDAVLERLPGADVKFVLSDASRPLVIADWKTADDRSDLAVGLRALAHGISQRRDSAEGRPDEIALKIAQREVEGMLV